MKKRTMEKENQAEERRKKILMEIAGTVVCTDCNRKYWSFASWNR